MTYGLDWSSEKDTYIVLDEENPEALATFKRIFNLPNKTAEIRIYGIDAEYFVKGETPVLQ